MKLGKNAKKAGALVAIISFVLVATIGVFSTGFFEQPVVGSDPIEPEPTYPVNHLFVDASYLLKTGETNDSVNVSCDLFMTNIWEKESGEIKAIAYVSEQNTNFATFKSSVEFGIIDANSTKELNIPVKFADNSYKVEILIFESNKLVKKATLSLNIYQNYYFGAKGDIVYNEGRTKLHVDTDGQWSIESGSISVESVR